MVQREPFFPSPPRAAFEVVHLSAAITDEAAVDIHPLEILEQRFFAKLEQQSGLTLEGAAPESNAPALQYIENGNSIADHQISILIQAYPNETDAALQRALQRRGIRGTSKLTFFVVAFL
jgi:hypothetical protein